MDIPGFDPADFPMFVHTRGFERRWADLGLGDADLAALEAAIRADPTAAPVVPQAGGFRKVRFAPPSWNAGKSGATRVLYAYFLEAGAVVLGSVYGKGEKGDLTAGEKKALVALAAEFGRILDGPEGDE